MKIKPWEKVVNYVIAVIAAIIAIFPLYWTLITSFKNYKEAFAQPPTFIAVFNFSNYISFLSQNKILLYLKNSVVIAVFSTAIPLILGLLPPMR